MPRPGIRRIKPYQIGSYTEDLLFFSVLFFSAHTEKESAFFGQAFMHSPHLIHSGLFGSQEGSTFIRHAPAHFPQCMQSFSLQFILRRLIF